MNNTDKEKLDNWARESIPILKEHGYLKNRTIMWVMVAFVFWSSTMGMFYYAGKQDWFKSIITQEVEVEPQINNSYLFAPITENDYNNKYNFTIQNNIVIPEGVCG